MKLGALDVGSNTVLMLVVECAAGKKPRVIAEMSRITRLGHGVDAHGHLDPESAARTLDAIDEFTDRARDLGAEKIVGAATAALRDAADGADFLESVKKRRSGFALEIITGQTEARALLIYPPKGARNKFGREIVDPHIGGRFD